MMQVSALLFSSTYQTFVPLLERFQSSTTKIASLSLHILRITNITINKYKKKAQTWAIWSQQLTHFSDERDERTPSYVKNVWWLALKAHRGIISIYSIYYAVIHHPAFYLEFYV